jgi:hypothetical protein
MNIYEKLQQRFKSKFKIYSRVNQLFHEILYNKFEFIINKLYNAYRINKNDMRSKRNNRRKKKKKKRIFLSLILANYFSYLK